MKGNLEMRLYDTETKTMAYKTPAMKAISATNCAKCQISECEQIIGTAKGCPMKTTVYIDREDSNGEKLFEGDYVNVTVDFVEGGTKAKKRLFVIVYEKTEINLHTKLPMVLGQFALRYMAEKLTDREMSDCIGKIEKVGNKFENQLDILEDYD